jgi:hypothetical protein
MNCLDLSSFQIRRKTGELIPIRGGSDWFYNTKTHHCMKYDIETGEEITHSPYAYTTYTRAQKEIMMELS